jgi:hypothetical protein
MNAAPHQHYVVDLYHQPQGYSHWVVKEQHRIMARSDAEGIREARAIFELRDAPCIRGFAVRSIGSRRFGDQAIYRHHKSAGGDELPITYQAVDEVGFR